MIQRFLKIFYMVIFLFLDIAGIIGATFYKFINEKVFYGNEKWLALAIPQSVMFVSTIAFIFLYEKKDECTSNSSLARECVCPKCRKKAVALQNTLSVWEESEKTQRDSSKEIIQRTT